MACRDGIRPSGQARPCWTRKKSSWVDSYDPGEFNAPTPVQHVSTCLVALGFPPELAPGGGSMGRHRSRATPGSLPGPLWTRSASYRPFALPPRGATQRSVWRRIGARTKKWPLKVVWLAPYASKAASKALGMAAKLTALEFYSGIGGMRYALDAATRTNRTNRGGHRVLAAFDLNPVANAVYEHNFGVRPIQGNLGA
jgi:hypothetical protein